MLTRQATPVKSEPGWFLFSSSLMEKLCSDYIAMRLLLVLEPLTTAWTYLPKMLDVAEKSLKVHIAVRTRSDTALSDARREFGHNIDSLRAACATFDKAFDDPDIRAFTKDLSDHSGQLYQYLRYGSHPTTRGFESRPTQLIQVVDRIFAYALLRLPERDRTLLLAGSSLKHLLRGSRFDQSANPELLIKAVSTDNAYFEEFVALFKAMDQKTEQDTAQ